jgi:hypothetical protein
MKTRKSILLAMVIAAAIPMLMTGCKESSNQPGVNPPEVPEHPKAPEHPEHPKK